MARHARYHGLERRSRGIWRHLSADDSRFRCRASRSRGDRNSRPDEAFGRRCRSLHLSSRRDESDCRARARAIAGSRDTRSRARGHCRLRQHVGADHIVRARTRHGPGFAGAVAADSARPRLHRKLRRVAARRVSLASTILLLVTLQRLGELVLSRYNTRRLLARGAIEVGAGHYPLIVSVHTAWLIALWIWGRDQDVNIPALAGFIALQGLRLWILATLGPRWTTRIIVLPGEPLVASGPYRYLAHPNYAVVAGEIGLLPLALHLPLLALIFTALNAAVLAIRIRAETHALSATGRRLARPVR